MTVITPIIHLNGDRRETLLAQLTTAYRAVSDAMNWLSQCTPNGRNYYPEPGRLQLAEHQHHARMQHLQAVYKSLEAEAIQIMRESREPAAPRPIERMKRKYLEQLLNTVGDILNITPDTSRVSSKK